VIFRFTSTPSTGDSSYFGCNLAQGASVILNRLSLAGMQRAKFSQECANRLRVVCLLREAFQSLGGLKLGERLFPSLSNQGSINLASLTRCLVFVGSLELKELPTILVSDLYGVIAIGISSALSMADMFKHPFQPMTNIALGKGCRQIVGTFGVQDRILVPSFAMLSTLEILC
jgi:hypothetical protein